MTTPNKKPAPDTVAAGRPGRHAGDAAVAPPPQGPGKPEEPATVKDRFDTARQTAADKAQTLRAKGAETVAKARQAAADPANQPKVKGGAAAGAGTAALTAVVWAIRRRTAQPSTQWEKTLASVADALDEAGKRAEQVAQHPATEQTVEKARQAAATIAAHPLTQKAIDKAKEAAAAPEAKPRAQGAAAALGTVVTLVVLKRAARRTPSAR
ncbi:hypothetical protein [Actinocorallia longicatena]|uniref:DUF3618 domain-containing protein n=1 Tax=Actinocorallia longicatena TaxID=111803 RepID=A0ABP6PVI3_9ACTN